MCVCVYFCVSYKPQCTYSVLATVESLCWEFWMGAEEGWSPGGVIGQWGNGAMGQWGMGGMRRKEEEKEEKKKYSGYDMLLNICLLGLGLLFGTCSPHTHPPPSPTQRPPNTPPTITPHHNPPLHIYITYGRFFKRNNKNYTLHTKYIIYKIQNKRKKEVGLLRKKDGVRRGRG